MDALGLLVLIVLIAVALLFDFLNGLHDAANSIATIVSTRVLRPHRRWSGRRSSTSSPSCSSACTWRRRSAPASSTPASSTRGDLRRADGRDRLERDHLAGRHSVQQLPRPDRRAGRRRRRQGRVRRGRLGGRRQDRRGHRAVAADRLRPGAAAGADRLLDCSCGRRPPVADSIFRMLQFVSAALYSLGHGGNDAQKTMGIIAVLLYRARRMLGPSSTCRSGW